MKMKKKMFFVLVTIFAAGGLLVFVYGGESAKAVSPCSSNTDIMRSLCSTPGLASTDPIVRLEGDCDSDNLTPENCDIIAYIRLFTDALLTIVGIVIIMTIVIGGIQYSAAGDKSQAVAAAKKRISQALIALVIYLFMFAFLQWLVPGGVF